MDRVKPKKHLGQHFLRDENVALKIVASLSTKDSGTLLEIGPGTGVLTRHLLQGARLGARLEARLEFFALDVDSESIDYLKAHYPGHREKFLLQDFLQTDLGAFQPPVTIIGNFPYNISSQIFFRIWDQRDRVDEVVCMIQKEVADRISSREGSKVYGILSVLLQAFFDISYLFTVPPGVFLPPPKVQSAVIRLRRNETARLRCDEALFKRVVKAAFGKRRKTLRNALKDLNLSPALTSGAIFDRRAEQLTVKEFEELTFKISS